MNSGGNVKVFYIFLLVLLSSCHSQVGNKKPSTSTAINGLAKLYGTYSLCTVSGGADGDYKITHVISGNNYYFTEYYYSSHDGSCTNPIARTSGVQNIVEGSGKSSYFPDAVAVDLTFTAPLTITALTGDADAMNQVSSRTNEAAPSVGVAYNVTKANGGYVPLFFSPPSVAGQKGYTFFYVDTGKNPKTLIMGGSFSSTSATRDGSLDSTEYLKE